MFDLTQEKERKARRRGKTLQNEEASAPYAAEEEEMEGSGASGNEEEAPEDGEGTPLPRDTCIMQIAKTFDFFEHNKCFTVSKRRLFYYTV